MQSRAKGVILTVQNRRVNFVPVRICFRNVCKRVGFDIVEQR